MQKNSIFCECSLIFSHFGERPNEIGRFDLKVLMHDRLYRYVKKPIALLLIFAMLAQVFSKAIIVLSYQANKTYIAQNLCENRKNPGLHCAGKCQLKKKLEKDKQEDRKNLEKKSIKETVATLPVCCLPPYCPRSFGRTEKKKYPYKKEGYPSTIPDQPLRPPIA